MAEPLTGNRSRSRLRSFATAGPTDEELLLENAERTARMSALERGFAAGGYGITAGSYADEAQTAERAGDDVEFQRLLGQATTNAQRAAQVGPAVSSLRDINSLSDAGTFVGGHLGQAAATMAPVMLGALAARTGAGRLAGASSYLGAAVPAYQMEQGEAILNQYQDPQLAAMDVERRAELARNKALGNAALESIVPAMLSKGLFRTGASPLRTIGQSMVTEGATEAAQETGGLLAQETLRQGSLAAALPTLDTPENRQRVLDASAAGAIGGGGISLPTAGTQLAADALAKAGKAGKDAAGKAVDAAKGAVEGTAEGMAGLRQRADQTIEDFDFQNMSDEDVVNELNRRATGPDPIVPEDPRMKSTDPAEVAAALADQEANAPTLRAKAAQNILNDPKAPDELRAMAARVLSPDPTPEDDAQILGHAAGYQAARATKFVAAKGIVALDEAIKFGKEQFAAAKAKMGEGKKNAMDPAEEPALVEALFKELKPEFQFEKGVRDRLAPMVQLFRRLDEMDDYGVEVHDLMQKLARGGEPMFGDMKKVIPKSLTRVYEDATRAQTEAKDENSWLSQNLTPVFRGLAKPETRQMLGRMIDRMAIKGEEPGSREMALLRQAFGSKQAAKTMLRHYKLQVNFLKRPKNDAEPEGDDLRMDAAVPEDAEEGPQTQLDARQEAIGERERLAGVSYEFDGADGDTPFFAPRLIDGKTTKRSQLAHSLRTRNAQDRSVRSRLVTLADVAKERELSLDQTAQYVQRFIDAKNKQDKQDDQRKQKAGAALRAGQALTPAQEKELADIDGRVKLRGLTTAKIENAGYDPEKPLIEQPEVVEALSRELQVIRSEKSAISGNTGRTAPELYVAGRKGVQQTRTIDTRPGPNQKKNTKTLERLKGSLFKVYRMQPNGVERPYELSAATLLKGARETTQSTGERDDVYTQRLLTEALGDLATSDKTITRFEGLNGGLIIDVDTGQTLGREVTVKGTAAIEEAMAAARDIVKTERKALEADKAELEELMDEYQDDQTPDMLESIKEVLARMDARARVFSEAIQFSAPTELAKQKLEDRIEAEVRSPAAKSKMKDIKKAAAAAANGKTKEESREIWSAAFKAYNQIVMDNVLSEPLQLAMRARLGMGNTAMKALRDEYRQATDSVRDDLRNLQAESSFGDTAGVDHRTDVETLDEIRNFGDFGEQLHGKEDQFSSTPKAQADIRAQALRAYESLALQKARLAQYVAKAVKDYFVDNDFPTTKDPVKFAAAMKAIFQYTEASRAKKEDLTRRYEKMSSTSTDTLAKQIGGRMIANARARRDTVRQAQATEQQKNEDALAWIEQRKAAEEKAKSTDEAVLARAWLAAWELSGKPKPPTPPKGGRKKKRTLAEEKEEQFYKDNPPQELGTFDSIEAAEVAASKHLQRTVGGSGPGGRKKNSLQEPYYENNGSGDSSASIEAINRSRDEKAAGQTRLLIDRDGTIEELEGVDAVDRNARAGQIIIQRGIGRDEWTILSQGNDVSPALAQGRINAARYRYRFSSQSTKTSGIGISKKLKNDIMAEITRITGLRNTRRKQHLFFVPKGEIDGASGEYTEAQRAIKIAISAVDPLGVAYHEALHDFIAGLQASPEGRDLRKALFKAGEMPHVRAQLKELLKNHPEALKQIEADPEERVAYMFQFWAVGKYLGKPIFKVNDKAARNALEKLADWIRGLLSVLSESEKAEAVLEALYEGKFADRNIVGAVIQDMKLDTFTDKARRIAGPLADVSDKLMLVATDRLRDFGVAAADELADMFATEPGREQGGLRFLQRRSKLAAQYLNKVSSLFDNTTATERAQALRNLQSMKAPSTPLEKQVRAILDDLHAYMVEAGVKRAEMEDGQIVWKDLGKIKNYFPRKWDANKILNNEAEFKALLQLHGNVGLEQQAAIIKSISHGDDHDQLSGNQYHIGYTPFSAAVNERQLSFINEGNAAEFAKFQNDDLADVLTGYIFQATHRAEFARDFGNDGKVIDDKIQEAAKYLDGKQIAAMTNTVKGLVGTLGADVNPRMKDLMSAAITTENIILLPLTIFSQFIDALGVGLRAQSSIEAWNAFKRGMGDFAKAVRRKKGEQPDYDEAMAKTIGLIDEQNMLEAMGQAHAGAFMSQYARNINRKFFKWNGMESWNRSMRISAMVAGERFIQREVGNTRFMNELGLEPSDVMVKPDGRLAVTAEQMIALGASKKQAAARELKVQDALFRFVDGAVLRPNAAQRPVWMSDPHWMLVAHLKQFAFSFQKTILSRVNNEFEHGQMMPAAILAAYVPVTIASGLTKSMLTGQPIGDGGLVDILNYGVMRSGILGSGSFGADAMTDLERGLLPGSSLIGPTMEHAWLASRFVVGDEAIDAGRVIDRSLPFARYF